MLKRLKKKRERKKATQATVANQTVTVRFVSQGNWSFNVTLSPAGNKQTDGRGCFCCEDRNELHAILNNSTNLPSFTAALIPTVSSLREMCALKRIVPRGGNNRTDKSSRMHNGEITGRRGGGSRIGKPIRWDFDRTENWNSKGNIGSFRKVIIPFWKFPSFLWDNCDYFLREKRFRRIYSSINSLFARSFMKLQS